MKALQIHTLKSSEGILSSFAPSKAYLCLPLYFQWGLCVQMANTMSPIYSHTHWSLLSMYVHSKHCIPVSRQMLKAFNYRSQAFLYWV